MDQKTRKLPGRSLELLFMGAAAHEVECEGHVAVADRDSRPAGSEPGRRAAGAADVDRLFRGP